MLGDEFLIGRQIKFQVEAYMCRHVKFKNTHIENGHIVTFICASVERNHLFWPRRHIRR
jgi:hypothetical protein